MPRTNMSSIHPTLRPLDQFAKELGDLSHAHKSNSRQDKEDTGNMSEKQNKKWHSQIATEKAREKKKHYRHLLESTLDTTSAIVSSLKLEIEQKRNENSLIRSRITEFNEFSTHNMLHGFDEITGLNDI